MVAACVSRRLSQWRMSSRTGICRCIASRSCYNNPVLAKQALGDHSHDGSICHPICRPTRLGQVPSTSRGLASVSVNGTVKTNESRFQRPPIVKHDDDDDDASAAALQSVSEHDEPPAFRRVGFTSRPSVKHLSLNDGLFSSASNEPKHIRRVEKESHALDEQSPSPGSSDQTIELLEKLQEVRISLQDMNTFSQFLKLDRDKVYAISQLEADNFSDRRERDDIYGFIERCSQDVTNLHTLYALNDIASRFKRADLPVPASVIYHGLLASAREGLAPAFMNYLEMHDGSRTFVTNRTWEEIFEFILHSTTGAAAQGWHSQRQKQQWLRILTGWEAPDCKAPCKRQNPNLFGITGCDHPIVDAGSLMAKYFQLLFRLGDSKLQRDEWTSLRRDMQERWTPKYHSYLRTVGIIIDALLIKNEPAEAWRVAFEYLHIGGRLKHSWNTLLEHPEFLNEWHESMTPFALESLMNMLRNIEATMGIQWTGGENGYHQAMCSPEDGTLKNKTKKQARNRGFEDTTH